MKFALLALPLASAMNLEKIWADIPRNGTGKSAPSYSTAVSCSTANAIAKNFVVEITPERPASGEDVATRFVYDLSEEVVQGATASYAVTYNFLPISPTVDDLCADQISPTGSGDKCPLAATHHDSTAHQPFPSGVSGSERGRTRKGLPVSPHIFTPPFPFPTRQPS